MKNFEIAKPIRGMESDMAYPQYAYKYGSHIIMTTDAWIQLQEYALGLSNNKCFPISEKVQEHWNNILAGIVPFGMRIVRPVKKSIGSEEGFSQTRCNAIMGGMSSIIG